MAEEADAATAAWREEMGDAGGADGARPAGAHRLPGQLSPAHREET